MRSLRAHAENVAPLSVSSQAYHTSRAEDDGANETSSVPTSTSER